jgi:predicted lactoylglutathione lyase
MKQFLTSLGFNENAAVAVENATKKVYGDNIETTLVRKGTKISANLPRVKSNT